MKKTIRILLADDHAMVRDGLVAILAQQVDFDFEVVSAVADGRQAVEQAIRTQPDIALIDIAMPELNGLEATEQIHEACPSVHIIIVSMYSNIEYVYRALRAGAQGYMVKTSAGQDVTEAVKTVLAGRRYLSQGITESVLDDYIRARSTRSPLEQLSTRERQILQRMSEGRSSVEIAKSLSLSPKTVDTYRSRIMEKLGITELPALIKFAIQHGMTPPE
jgi:DNA-binding NarL/FixJ family response regulator